MARFEFTTPSGKSSYKIVDEFVTIGREVGNHLRLSDPAVAPVHLRLSHGQSGYRLELADAELKVKVNGEHCVARSLQPNDRIEIGETTLTFVDERAAPAPPPVEEPAVHGSQPEPRHRPRAAAPQKPRHAPQPAATHSPRPHHAGAGHHHAGAAHHHSGAGHHHGKKEKRPAWVTWVGWSALAFVCVMIFLKLIGAGSYYDEESSPAHWLKVAQGNFDDGDLPRALDSCKRAEFLKPDSYTQERLKELRVRIDAGMVRAADAPNIKLAKSSLEAMQQFETTYLGGATPPRAAARDLARKAQLWLKNYSDSMRRYPDTAPDVPKAQSLFDRYAPVAQLERPDDAGDVQFAIDQFLALPRPLYREALSKIDGYLAVHPKEAEGVLMTVRNKVVNTARAEFDRHEAEARRLVAARRFGEARKEVQAMRDVIVDDAWVRLAEAVERDIPRSEK